MGLPDQISLNASTGDDEEVSGPLADRANRWGSTGDMLPKQEPLAPPDKADPSSWGHPDIGWGVVLPDRNDMSDREKALAVDAPAPIQQLLAARPGSPVLRYRTDLGGRKLARYFEDGTPRQDPTVGLSKFGTGKGRLPMYVLLVGSPSEIPWDVQYSLNRRHYAGRLALDPAGLANYVRALLSNWDGASADPERPLVWSVNADSMTNKMDATIAAQVEAALKRDADLVNRTVLRGQAATCDALVTALTTTKPAVIVTSSHGRTGPIGDPDAMRSQLGLPVDAARRTLDPDALLASWSPAGAVWYGQACCSAGSADGTSYAGLLAEGSLPERVVQAVGNLGAGVAPLPTRLLSASAPLRAFIGHVEPTFDWTLLADGTGQFLTTPLVDAVYPRLYQRQPVGRAFEEHFRGVGVLYGELAEAREDVNKVVAGARERATYYRLTATDRESLVILGDPTALIPLLPSQRAGSPATA